MNKIVEAFQNIYGIISPAHVHDILDLAKTIEESGRADDFIRIARKIHGTAEQRFKPNPTTLMQKAYAEMNAEKVDDEIFTPEAGPDKMLYQFHKKYGWVDDYLKMRSAWLQRYKESDLSILRQALINWNSERVDEKAPYPKSVAEYYKQIHVRKRTQQKLEEKPTNYMKQAVMSAETFDPTKCSDHAVSLYGQTIKAIRANRPNTGAYDSNGMLRHDSGSPLLEVANKTVAEYERRFPNG